MDGIIHPSVGLRNDRKISAVNTDVAEPIAKPMVKYSTRFACLSTRYNWYIKVPVTICTTTTAAQIAATVSGTWHKMNAVKSVRTVAQTTRALIGKTVLVIAQLFEAPASGVARNSPAVLHSINTRKLITIKSWNRNFYNPLPCFDHLQNNFSIKIKIIGV